MVNTKRILTEKALAKHYSAKLNGTVSCLFDESKRAYCIYGSGLPAHPDMVAQYPNGWEMVDYIKPAKVAEILGIKPERESKRILSVVIKREVDTDPDFSYYGEYSNRKTSEYSIDRAHDEDCQIYSGKPAIETLERVIAYLVHESQYASKAEDREWYAVADESADLLIEKQDELAECDCGRSWSGREYRYFNASSNYVDGKGNPCDGLTDTEVRSYVRQDYDRMEAYNAQQWCFVGVFAEAEYTVDSVVQTVRSGGLWGTESDSDDSHFAGIESDELATLKSELRAIGFSTRAMATAFKSVEHTA